MSYRTENGIPNIPNGNGKILQKQIDLLHEDVIEIKKDVKIIVPLCAENKTRSSMNSKLVFVLIAAVVTLGAAMIAL